MTTYPPLAEQAPLDIMVEAGALERMLTSGGFRLWVTDSVQPTRLEDVPLVNRGDESAGIVFWYWGQVRTHPNSHPICTADDIMAALRRQQRISFHMVQAADPKTAYTVQIPRTHPPAETARFMQWMEGGQP